MTKHDEVIILGHMSGRNRLSQKPELFPKDKREQKVSLELGPKRQDSPSSESRTVGTATTNGTMVPRLRRLCSWFHSPHAFPLEPY